MKHIGLALAAATALTAQAETRMERSRELTQQFMANLKQELTAAMAAGGPVAAVEVCKVKAPRIAARLSGEPGPQVGLLGGDAHGAGVEVTLAHHDAAHRHERRCGEAELLGGVGVALEPVGRKRVGLARERREADAELHATA